MMVRIKVHIFDVIQVVIFVLWGCEDMKALVMLSGGTDSAILTALAVKKYGADNVKTISYFYA